MWSWGIKPFRALTFIDWRIKIHSPLSLTLQTTYLSYSPASLPLKLSISKASPFLSLYSLCSHPDFCARLLKHGRRFIFLVRKWLVEDWWLCQSCFNDQPVQQMWTKTGFDNKFTKNILFWDAQNIFFYLLIPQLSESVDEYQSDTSALCFQNLKSVYLSVSGLC